MQILSLKASCSKPLTSPRSALLRVSSPKPFLKAPSFKAPCSKRSSFFSNFFLSRLFFFKAFSFKAFCSKRFLQRIWKDIKGSRNQTSCCETLSRRNLSATMSATYVRPVFYKILGAAVRREALLEKKDTYLGGHNSKICKIQQGWAVEI